MRLGKLIGQAGYTLLTGGYIGSMEALSRGCSEAGGHVIGVTCDQIEAWRAVKANAWVQEEWHYASLQERLFALIENCDGFLALPGGVGTLAEIMLAGSTATRSASPLPHLDRFRVAKNHPGVPYRARRLYSGSTAPVGLIRPGC
jgi:uncharacterized protein (TIGR00725 family)